MNHPDRRIVQDFRINRVEAQETVPPHLTRYTRKSSEERACEHEQAEDSAAASVVPRSEVLGREGYRTLCERRSDVVHQKIIVQRCSTPRRRVGADAVDRSLNAHVRDREQRSLQSRR